jgi:hypothetical protein
MDIEKKLLAYSLKGYTLYNHEEKILNILRGLSVIDIRPPLLKIGNCMNIRGQDIQILKKLQLMQ